MEKLVSKVFVMDIFGPWAMSAAGPIVLPVMTPVLFSIASLLLWKVRKPVSHLECQRPGVIGPYWHTVWNC